MQCPVCHFENPPGARFCQECGQRLQENNPSGPSSSAGMPDVCPQCHSPIEPGMPFCPSCGLSFDQAHAAMPRGRITEVTSIVTDVDKTILCPECGCEVSARERICPHCHADLYPVSSSMGVPTAPSAFTGPQGLAATEPEIPGFAAGYQDPVQAYAGNKQAVQNAYGSPWDSQGYGNQSSGRTTSFTGRPDQLCCPACGAMNEPDSSFCQCCGQNLNTQTVQPKSKRGYVKGWNQTGYSSAVSADGAMQAPQNYQAAMQCSQYSMARPQKKRSLSLILAPVISAAVMIGCLTGGCFMMNAAHSPEKTARTFITYLCNTQTRQAYEMLEMSPDDSAFLSLEAFERLNRQMNLGQTSSIGLTRQSEASAAEGGTLIADSVYEATLEQKDGLEPVTQQVIIEKTGRKDFLFFTDWKISDWNLTARNIRVQVPHEAQLTIDGEPVEAALLQSQGDDQNLDVYVIPALFKTEYTFAMQAEGIEKMEETASIDADGQDIVLDQRALSDEGIRTLQAESIEDLSRIYTCVLSRAPYVEAASLFSGSAEKTREGYGELLREFMAGTATVESLTLSEITASSSADSAEVHLRFHYDAKVSPLMYPERSRMDNGIKETVFSYVKEDGHWVLSSFPDLSLGL